MDRSGSHAGGAGHAAVTPHHLATAAAIDVMAAGGNAADGAVAANAVLGVVLPTTCGIGGDLFALVHIPGGGAPDALNASGRGGSGLDAGALAAAGHDRIPLYGPEAVTVPGCVDGWEALAARHGTLPLADLLAPAIALARGGFPVSAELAAGLARLHERIGAQPSAGPLYPGGRPPAPGDTLHRPLLAGTLEAVASRGRAAFYEGPIAEAVAGATGGVLTPDDLAGDRAEWVDPLGLEVMGTTAWTIPPNSQGYLALAAAWLFERLMVPADPGDPAFHHAAIESYRAMAWEREHTVADPAFAPLSPRELVDPGRLSSRLGRLRSGSAAAWPGPRPDDGGTAFLCTADAAGMGVSLIQSNFHGIGTGISAGGTGVWLHNRGAGFTLEPGHPNRAAPGKRPLHTLSPTLWSDGGALRMLLGTRGGHQQPQYLLQAAALVRRCGLSPAEAQAVPRWSMDHAAAGTASHVQVEQRMPDPVVAGLQRRGHAVERVPDHQPGWGPVSIITAGAGEYAAAADPRVSTATASVAAAGPGSPSR